MAEGAEAMVLMPEAACKWVASGWQAANTSIEISHGVFKALNLIFCIMVYCHHFDFIIDFHVQPCMVLSFSVGKVKYWP